MARRTLENPRMAEAFPEAPSGAVEASGGERGSVLEVMLYIYIYIYTYTIRL